MHIMPSDTAASAGVECIVQQTNPADPFAERPDIGRDLKRALRAA